MSWYDAFDPGAYSRSQLNNTSANAAGFAQQGQGLFLGDQSNIDAVRRQLADQASGKVSLSGEQLRQATQANAGTQYGMAAAAAPRNQAAAMQNAMWNAARLNYGATGQQAMAGIAERQAANQALSELALQQRQQDLNATLGGYQNAITGYGGANANPGPSMMSAIGPAVSAGLGLAAMSDRRTKRDIADGDEATTKLLDGLKSYTFKYKNAAHGAGEQLGVMAQDLEKVAPHVVIDTPGGKMVHGAKLATALAAASSQMHRRIAKLEERADDAAPLPRARVVADRRRS